MIDRTLLKVAVGIILLGVVLVLAVGCRTTVDIDPVPGPHKPAVLEVVPHDCPCPQGRCFREEEWR